jgi:hypothetical protein
MIWRETEKGKRIPLDPEPVVDGNIRLNGTRCHTLTELELSAANQDGELLYKSHFATCPDAAKHRKKK